MSNWPLYTLRMKLRRITPDKLSRPPGERIQLIYRRIQEGSYPNCVALAAELELSRITLKRDVLFMRDRLRLPIEYDATRHGYYFRAPAEPLPGAEAALSPKTYLRGSFGALKGRSDYEVAIQLDPWATGLARGRQWHSTQRFIELPCGCAQLELRLSSLGEIEPWVLSWGMHATILRPEALVRRVEQTARELLERYGAADHV